MFAIMFQTLLLSLLICVLNYIASSNSDLDSAKTILIDSIADLMFPIMSMLSIYNHKLDTILSLIQLLMIVTISIYFIINLLRKDNKDGNNSFLTLGATLISFIITLYCARITSNAAASADLMSIGATAAHFEIDVFAKLCVIFISLVDMIKSRRKKHIIRALDVITIIVILCMSSYNLYKFIRKVFI